ncbi:hypothetical protein ABIC71_000922 [Herbaspirillum seropedicae]|uniref:hypothetical protein n=1 Tax=Herbaspirillum seropedicae TaxID=964 RepID=UPI0033974469
MNESESTPLTGEVSLRAYARHRGCALYSVQKALEAGRIKKTASGRIDVAAADAAWAANTDVSRLPPDARHSARTGTAAAGGGDDEDENEQAGGTSEYQVHRARREKIRAEKEQIELDQLAGRVIDVAEASRMAFTTFRTLRDAIMNVAPRIKDILAAESDPMKVEQIIETELASALDSIDIAKVLSDQDEEEMEDGGD